tara:strand:- start:227 stop:2911 length:2685 start_codon:yes stop_codon:yes gene_type:complete
MPELIYDIKFKIHSPETNVNPKKLTKEIKELQGEFDNLDDSNKNLSKGLATSNQALFSFSDLVQDSAQFSQGFSQGMRAIGNNVGFTAELIGNLNRRVTDHNESLTKAEIAQGKSKTTIGELGRSFKGTGGIILGLNIAVLASQFAFQALDKQLKKLTDTGRAQADAFAEIAKAFADFDTGAPDPFGLRARQIEIELLTEQLGDFESETKLFRESLDDLPPSLLLNTKAFRGFSEIFPIIGTSLVLVENGLKNLLPKAFTKLTASSDKAAADLVTLAENLSQTKKNLDAATFAQKAFQERLDSSQSGLKGFVELTGELEKVLLQDALGIQLTASSLESLSEATQEQIDLVIKRGIQTPEEIFTANQLILLQKQLKEAIDKTNESRTKEIQQLTKTFKAANDRRKSINENIFLLDFELQAIEETDKRAKIQAEAELERQEVITEARRRASEAKQEFIDQGIDKDKAAALAGGEIEAIDKETRLKLQIISAEESLKLQKLTDEESKEQESNALKDRQQARDDANAQLRATEAELRAELLSIKGAANEKDKRDEIAALAFNAKIKAISLDETLSAIETESAIIVAASEFNIQIAKNEADEIARIEEEKQDRLAQIRDEANAKLRVKQAMSNLKLLELEDVFGEKLIDIFGDRADLQEKNEVAITDLQDKLANIRADNALSTEEKRLAIAKAGLEASTDIINNEQEAAKNAAKNLEDTIDIAGKAANAFLSLSSQKIDSDIQEAKARGASAKEIEKLERKKFELNKKAQLGNAIINTAANVIEAKPPSPKSIAAAAIGAIQIATILRTKFGGGAPSSSGGASSTRSAERESAGFTQSVSFLNNAQGSETPSRRLPDFVPSSPITNQAAPTVDVNIDRAGLAIAVNRGQQDLLNNSTSI